MTTVREHLMRWQLGTWQPDAWQPGDSGLERLQAAQAGRVATPAASALIGLRMHSAAPGRVRVALRPAEFHYNPIGSVHGGVIATALNMATAWCVLSLLPPGRDCLTLEIKVNYLRALTEAAGEVFAEGVAVHAGEQVAVAEGRLVAADGKLFATVSTTLLVFDRREKPGAAPAGEALADEAMASEALERVVRWDDPAPGVRAGAAMTGLDLLRAMRDGALPRAPVAALIGMRMGEIEAGAVSMSLVPGWFLNDSDGAMHGGVIATLLDSVMSCSVHSTLPAGRGYTTLELKVNYVRAITDSSGVITGHGEVVHAGRQVAVASGRAVDAAGRVCATASTTCLVFDRPA